MPKKTTVQCDVTDCEAQTEMTPLAGSLQGWIRRDVTDTCNKHMAEGMRNFSASTTLYLCPEHAREAHSLPNPGTHPDVVQFLEQPEVHSTP